MKEALAISVGAMLGANLRYLLFELGRRWLPSLPLGTFAANVLGTFGLALFVTVVAPRASLSSETRLMVTTGFFGALTTFSTFSIEVVALVQREQGGWALAYLLSSILIGLVAVLAGIGAGVLVNRYL